MTIRLVENHFLKVNKSLQIHKIPKINVILPKRTDTLPKIENVSNYFSIKFFISIGIAIFLMVYMYYFVISNELCPDEEFLATLPVGVRNNDFFGKYKTPEIENTNDNLLPVYETNLPFSAF